MPYSKLRPWGTERELVFIAGLGTFSEKAIPRNELLKTYQLALTRRVRWESIEPVKVQAAVISAIKETI